MAEDKPRGWGKKFLLWALTSPVTLIFVVLMLYYGTQAYVLGNSPWQNKVIMAGITVIWILWLVFKNLIKFLILALVAGGLFYSYYRFENRDEIACKEQGRVWDKENKTCTDKQGWMEKLEKLWQEYTGDNKTADDQAKTKTEKADTGIAEKK